jgi:hypothetical protein
LRAWRPTIPRGTIMGKALIVANTFLEAELEKLAGRSLDWLRAREAVRRGKDTAARSEGLV